ncbi:MAG: DUF4160 domain-containing protein [Azonexus sp.]|jgi:hypothetical protein|nr:DUF4160 domain-containing protein [Azonexus sp.]
MPCWRIENISISYTYEHKTPHPQCFRIELRERDHLPPHVHLTGAGVNVMISLESLATAGACPPAVLQEALAWVAANQTVLMEEWKKWHP